jgi:hypothetical protein
MLPITAFFKFMVFLLVYLISRRIITSIALSQVTTMQRELFTSFDETRLGLWLLSVTRSSW